MAFLFVIASMVGLKVQKTTYPSLCMTQMRCFYIVIFYLVFSSKGLDLRKRSNK